MFMSPKADRDACLGFWPWKLAHLWKKKLSLADEQVKKKKDNQVHYFNTNNRELKTLLTFG